MKKAGAPKAAEAPKAARQELPKAPTGIDGLDEIFDPEAREAAARQIVGFATMYPKVRILATSRVIGFPQHIMESAGFAIYALQDLDESQVEQFVDRWYKLAMDDRPGEAEQRRARITRSFRESASMRQLSGNPMLLTIMAMIGKGGFLQDTVDAMKEQGGVYLAIVGGAAALETLQIEEIEQVWWEDLMPECLWKFRVRDFGPLIVGMDTHGESLYENVQVEARKRLEETIYSRL